MRRYLYFLFTTIFIVYCVEFYGGGAQLYSANEAKIALSDIDAVINKYLKEYLVPGLAIGIIVNDEVVVRQGYGYSNIDKSKRVSDKTVFAIGSITKSFTSFIIGKLVEAGVIDWDRPVYEYLPGFRMYDDYATLNLTIRDLLCHRSGLPRHEFSWYNTKCSREELLDKLQYLPPVSDIREIFNYQNLMFMTAGRVIEEITSSSWEKVVEEELLLPLKMYSTSFTVNDMKNCDDIAYPYISKGNNIIKIPYRTVSNIGPAIAMNSNVDDMITWMRLHLNDGICHGENFIDVDILREMHTPQMVISKYPNNFNKLICSYGMGWFIQTYKGHYNIEHGGNVDGFSSVISLMPHEKIGVVVLTNKHCSSITYKVVEYVFDKILKIESSFNCEKHEEEKHDHANDKETFQRKEGTKPTFHLDEYVGCYDNPGYGSIKIENNKGHLSACLHDINFPLEHWHYDVFVCRSDKINDMVFQVNNEKLVIFFRNNVLGEVEELVTCLDSQVGGVVFKRCEDEVICDENYLSSFVGEYRGGSVLFSVAMQLDELVLSVEGKNYFILIPKKENVFTISDGGDVSFIIDEKKQVVELVFKKADSTVRARKIS
jgi:CubicO group peptidase (beta-lactamase class C family)